MAVFMEEHLGLPKDVIRHQVHTGGMILSFKRSACARLSDGVKEELARRGLPQGSALSSLIAEWIIGEVLGSLTVRLPGVLMVVYADNFGLVVPRARAGAIEELLRDAFQRHDAGPFDLTTTGPQEIGREFKFLGYWWRVRDGQPTVYVPEPWLLDWAHTITADLLTIGWVEAERRRQVVLGKQANWSLSPDAIATCDEVLSALDGVTGEGASDWHVLQF